MILATLAMAQTAADQAAVDAQVRWLGLALLSIFGIVYFVVVVLVTWLAFRMLVRNGSLFWLIVALMGVGAVILPIGALINVPFGGS